MKYEWYPDIFFAVNFLMDASALLLAAVVCNQRVSSGRIFLLSASSVMINLILLLLLPSRLLYIILAHLVLHPLVVVLAFSPRGVGEFFRLLTAVYVLLFLAGGVQESLCIQFGQEGIGVILFDGILAAVLFTVWQVRRRVFSRLCVVELWFQEERISLKAYCDSGNMLRHPKNGRPVSIIERAVLPELWISQLPPAEKIACRTVSDSETWMEVMTFDRMDIYLQGRVKEIQMPEIGLKDGRIMQATDVQMLLNEAFC